MISSFRNVSRDYKLPWMETVQGLLIYKCFENHTNNQCEKLLNGKDIYGIHFQGYGVKIKDTSLLNILSAGVQPPVSVQNIVDCKGNIIGGHKKDDKFVVDILFDPMNELDPDKKLVDLHRFDGSSVCRK